MIVTPTNRRIIRPYEKPSFEHTQRYGLVRGHPLGPAGGLVCLLLANEAAGNKVFDLSGNGNDGTFVNNPIWVSGKSGSAIEFDGDSDDIVIANNDNLNFGRYNNFSIVVGFNTNANDSWQALAHKRETAGFYLGYRIVLTTTASQYRVSIGSSNNDVTGTYGINEHNQIIVTFGRGAAGTTILYENGVNIGSFASNDIDIDNTHDFYIGSKDHVQDWIDGLIEYAYIYNGILSASEIALIYREPFCMVQKATPVYFFVPAVVTERVELDYMEYADDAAAQAAYVSSDFEPGSWDLLDEDCAAIGDWADDDTGDAVSSVSPAGQFKFDSGPNSAANDDKAARTRDIGSYPNTFTIETKLYHDALGIRDDADSFELRCDQVDERIIARFASDGLWLYGTAPGYTEVGTNLVKCDGSAEWQTWRFLVTFTGEAGAGVCDVYLKDSTHNWEKVGSAIPCSTTGTHTEGKTWISQLGYGTNSRITHIDHLKIATGLQVPSLQCYSESAIKQQGSYSLKGIAILTSSLSETLTRTVSPIDLSNQTDIVFDVRASRTGSQFKIGIHDVGGTTTEHTVNIAEVDTWQEESWDISGVANANKDAIDSIIITILNADAENVFYIDNVYAILAVVIITPATFELALALPGPGLIYDGSASPSTLALALTSQAPQVLTAVIATPATFELALALPGSNLIYDCLVTPPASALALALPAPTVGGDIIVIPITFALGLAVLIPEVRVFYITIPPFMQKDLIEPYSGGAWLWLVEIAIPGYNTVRKIRNNEATIYGSNNFPKGNFIVSRQSFVSDGSIPQIMLQMAQDGTDDLENIVNATKGGTNGTVKIIRTCEKFVETPVANLEADYDVLTAGSDLQWVTFVLGIPNPLTQRIPLWLYSSKVCVLATPSLFKGVKCQYAGLDTTCTGLFEDCYAKGNARHWGAEIGLDPNAVRI